MPRPSGMRHTPARARRSEDQPVTRVAEEVDAHRTRRELTARDLQRRGLARAVRSEQREHLAGRDRDAHAVQHVDGAVGGADVEQLERGAGRRAVWPAAREPAVAARPSAPFGEVPATVGRRADWPTTSASSAVTSRSSASCSSGTAAPRRPRRGTRRARAGSPGPRPGSPKAMRRPKSSTWMWSQALITRLMSCSTSSTPRPSRRARGAARRARRSRARSRPDDGSSSRRTFGFVASARASSTSARCRWAACRPARRHRA